MYRLLLLIILSIPAYRAVPLRAQDRAPADRERVLEEVRATERDGISNARRWAAERRLPRRIVQSDGSIIELSAVHDGRPYYVGDANARAALLTGAAHLHPGGRTGLGITGRGLRIGLWDSGHARSDHIELSGRVEFGDDAEVSNHTTHVAGTLAATGIDPRARGMAFEASLTSYSWTNDATEMTNEATSGMVLSNHSYGVLSGWHFGDLEDAGERWYWLGDPGVSATEDYLFGRYDAAAVQFDRITHAHPNYLPVVAAGNDRLDTGPVSGTYRALDAAGDYQTYRVDMRPIPPDGGATGYDTISGAAVAKNVLTVGSVGYADEPTPSSFSSFGPTDDGRIKPDLVGAGENVFSLGAGRTTAYGISDGTSMATATVTGSLALVQQYHRNLFGAPMTAASLKGLALHTARDVYTDGPDYRTGWGLLDAEAAVLHIRDAVENVAALMEAELSDGALVAREVFVDDEGPLRVTLSWTDPPSVRTPRSGPSSLDNPVVHLRNDLDVRLIHRSTGTVYSPYVLDSSNPASPAMAGDNHVDPVEQIFVPEADTGAYSILVTHKGHLYGEPRQAFSLLVSGAHGPLVPVAIGHLEAAATLEGVTITWRTLFAPEPGTFVVERRRARTAKGADDTYRRIGTLAVGDAAGPGYSFRDPITLAGVYQYRILYEHGDLTYEAGSIEVNLPAPESYAVISSYPNPFTETATLVVDLTKSQQVAIEIFDVLGRLLVTAYDGELGAGRHRIDIHGADWASGVYLARVATPNGTAVYNFVKR